MINSTKQSEKHTLPETQIYLDYQATTPCDPRVLDKMLPYFCEFYGNAHSKTHMHGWIAKEGVEEARSRIAQLIGADPREIIFTSGATESNNLAIKGVARFYKDKKKHIVTCGTEHKCVLDTCRHLEEEGFSVTYLPVQPNGIIDLEVFKKSLREDTLLVSIMAVNNEIGVIQPIAEIGKICRERSVFFHTDAAQACGKMPLDVKAMNIDLMSISGHKMYGPKGIGALFVGRSPRVRLVPLINGGGQERGMRSGTLPAPLCIGMGEAASIALNEMTSDGERVSRLTKKMHDSINASLDHVYLNGDQTQRIPGNLNLSFAYVEGEGLIMGLGDLSVSSGSACTSDSLEPSYVLKALGIDEDLAHTSLRFGIGRFTTEDEVDRAVKKIVNAVNRLRELSPLWEMAQEGIDLKAIQWATH